MDNNQQATLPHGHIALKLHDSSPQESHCNNSRHGGGSEHRMAESLGQWAQRRHSLHKQDGAKDRLLPEVHDTRAGLTTLNHHLRARNLLTCSKTKCTNISKRCQCAEENCCLVTEHGYCFFDLYIAGKATFLVHTPARVPIVLHQSKRRQHEWSVQASQMRNIKIGREH